MNLEKAREYFSSYYEGTLERGLAEALSRAISTDAQLQAEYHAFERLMNELDVLKSPAPEPQFDLHEAISRRLDKHIHDQKARVKHPIFGLWRSLAVGGLATVALVAALFQLKNNGAQNVSTGDLLGGANVETVQLKSTESGLNLSYRTRGTRIVVIRDNAGNELERKVIQNNLFVAPLSNPNEKAALLQVDIQGEDLVFVALPGRRMQAATQGEGTVKDLAVSLAGFYRVPVLLKVGKLASNITWVFAPGEASDAAAKALEATNYTALKNEDGVLSIQPND